MANRNFSNSRIYSMHTMPVLVDCTITIGATGAVSSFTGPLVKSIVRTGTGLYTINLQDPYSGLYNLIGSAQSPVSGLSGVDSIETGNNANTTVQSLTAPSIAIKTLNASGALADPASGTKLMIMMHLSNSSVKVNGA
jgi:hypothetical protein